MNVNSCKTRDVFISGDSSLFLREGFTLSKGREQVLPRCSVLSIHLAADSFNTSPMRVFAKKELCS